MALVPVLKLNNGKEIPVVGLGTYQASDAEVEAAVRLAIDIGYRLIDTALIYGNEAGVGAAIRGMVQEGVVKREDIWVTSKLWNTHHSVEDVIPACKQSLVNLGLDYIDLYLIHWPFGLKSKDGPKLPQTFESFDLTGIEDTWKEMEKCVELGLVKSIGLSNFNPTQIQRVLDIAKIKPVVNQVEIHLMLNQRSLLEFCKSKDIVVEGYSPFGSPTRPDAPANADDVFKNEKVLQVANLHGKTPGQVILRYLVQLGVVVLPKSVTAERVKQNLDVFDFQLGADEVDLLAKLDCGHRVFPYLTVKDHPEYPFHDDK